jgi:hypothetical protein
MIVGLQQRGSIVVAKHPHRQVGGKEDVANKPTRDVAVCLTTRVAPPSLIVPWRQWVIHGCDDEVVIVGKEVPW